MPARAIALVAIAPFFFSIAAEISVTPSPIAKGSMNVINALNSSLS
jgi:hypothetical protein